MTETTICDKHGAVPTGAFGRCFICVDDKFRETYRYINSLDYCLEKSIVVPYDPINPDHYKSKTGLESIDVIEAFNLNFHLGNGIKYILRSVSREKDQAITDLQKAVWYLNREIERMEKTK